MKYFIILFSMLLLISCSSYQSLKKGDRIRVINIKRNAGKYGKVKHILKDRFGNDCSGLVKFDNSEGLSGINLVDIIKIEGK